MPKRASTLGMVAVILLPASSGRPASNAIRDEPDEISMHVPPIWWVPRWTMIFKVQDWHWESATSPVDALARGGSIMPYGRRF